MQRFRTHDGIELAYDETGDPDGPPVILLHGFAADTDRLALAAPQRAAIHGEPIDVSSITVPAPVVTGEADALVGDPVALAEGIPGGRAVVVSGDHLTAVVDPALTQAMVAFLDEHTT